MGADYFNLLGLPRYASAEEIRKAFFNAARRFHPDANPDPRAKEQFLEIQEAYDTLIDPEKRAAYSARLPDAEDNAKVFISSEHSREILPMLAEDQLFYSLLTLECPEIPQPEDILPLNLVLVVDRSTSMAGSRLDTVKYSIVQLLKQLERRDFISIVTFSDRAEIILPPIRVEDLKSIESRISSIQTGGATEIYRGLVCGVEQLHLNFNPHSVNHILLLTDGHTYGDEDPCFELIRQLVAEGGSLSAVGIGHEWNDEFMDKLTGLSGESTLFSPSPKDLHQSLKLKMEVLKSVYAKNISADFQPSPCCEFLAGYQIKPEVKPLPDVGGIPLGSLSFGSKVELLLELKIKSIPPDQNQVLLGRLDFSMDVPSAEVWKKRIFGEISRKAQFDPPREYPPRKLIQAMEMLSLYRLQEQARQETEAGDFKKAAIHLEYMSTNLLSKGQKELGQRVLLEMNNIKKSRAFSKDGDKRIKYGTRSLARDTLKDD